MWAQSRTSRWLLNSELRGAPLGGPLAILTVEVPCLRWIGGFAHSHLLIWRPSLFTFHSEDLVVAHCCDPDRTFGLFQAVNQSIPARDIGTTFHSKHQGCEAMCAGGGRERNCKLL
jgi:hypothetical protein